MKNLLFCALLVSGCANAQTNNQSAECDSTALPTDSIKTEIVEKYQKLPDTQFVSVENFEYEIKIFDTVHNGEIDNLKPRYDNTSNILTFRKNSFRNADFGGKVTGTPKNITVEWTFETDMDNTDTKYGRWGGGTGWTGQPLYVNWSDSLKEKFKSTPSANVTQNFNNQEIMIGSLASKVYFIDYETGKKSRTPLEVNNPIKGTISLDPDLNGKLYVGQGVPARLPYGQLTADLFTQTVKNTNMADGTAWRGWHASDSSPLRIGQFVFRPSENGTLYKFYVTDSLEILHSQMKYRKKGSSGPGMESSMSIYMNYGFIADNHGYIVCVNLDCLKPVWIYNNHDDTDATPVIEVEDGTPYIYIGCEMDRQGDLGQSHFAKINALTGDKIWDYTESAKKVKTGSKHFDGGYYATALLGHGDCDSLVFVNYVANDNGQNGYFYAFSKKDGTLKYKTKLNCYSWSSPVGFLNETGEMFVFSGDTHGYVYLFKGQTGEILCSKLLGINFESSPAVIDNHVVIGSRGNKIYKLKIE